VAEYFVDHGAYGASLSATPTWGVPLEGDGSAMAAATAAGTASIVFTANAAATNTVVVCGVTFTAVASGATGNQFNVGASLSATLDNLVTAINASTTAVGSGVALGTPQLRALVYARKTSTDTLDVMMRVGSATLNGATNTNCRLNAAGWAASTSLPVNFAGGSGGCWGHLVSTATIFNFAAGAYGALVASALVAAASGAPTVAANPGLSDVIYVRTGAGQTITLPSNTNLSSTPAYSHRLVFDTNTKWTGDSGTGVITLSFSGASADITIRLAPNTSGLRRVIQCLKRGSLRFYWAGQTTAGHFILQAWCNSGSNAPTLIEGVKFEEASSGIVTTSYIRAHCSGVLTTQFKNCDFVNATARTTWGGLIYGTLDGTLTFDGCTITNNHTAGGDPGPVNNASLSGSRSAVKFIGCSISGWPFGKYTPFSASQTYTDGSELLAQACTGFKLGAYLGLSVFASGNPGTVSYTFTDARVGLGCRYENRAGVVDWDPDAAPAYPTYRALQFDGATKWALKIDWFAGTVHCGAPLVTPRMGAISRLADGARTIEIDFLSPVALTPYDVVARVYYVDPTGKARCDSSLEQAGSLTSPSATWDNAASFPSHSPRRFTITTTQSVKQDTEIGVVLEMTGAPPGGSGIQMYVDPEPSVA
jgi:hypothetical protein